MFIVSENLKYKNQKLWKLQAVKLAICFTGYNLQQLCNRQSHPSVWWKFQDF